MTITRIVELSCDTPDCELAYAPDATEMTSVRATLVGARRAGWTSRDGHHHCPGHSDGSKAALIAVIRGLAAKHQTDSQIAAGLGMKPWNVQRLRQENEIPAGVRPGRPNGWPNR